MPPDESVVQCLSPRTVAVVIAQARVTPLPERITPEDNPTRIVADPNGELRDAVAAMVAPVVCGNVKNPVVHVPSSVSVCV
jgi:hypothetical protein